MLKRPRMMSGTVRSPSQGSSRWAESGGRSRLPSPMVGVVAVVGVGPGLGAAIARRFARERFTVAILSRDLGSCWGFYLHIEKCRFCGFGDLVLFPGILDVGVLF